MVQSMSQEEHEFGDGTFGGTVIAADDTCLEKLQTGFVTSHLNGATLALGDVDDDRLMEFTESYRRLSYMPEPKKKRFSLTNSLHNLGLLLQSDFENAHIHFILRSTPSDIYIEGDEKQLSQVFLNLLKNSMQSLEGKTDGQIEVTLEVTNKLYIRLLDNGRGIPMELQEKIFVPFFTTKTEGTGIGLSLCRQIIKRHGGNFYLQESRQGKTIFVIEWPVASFILK